MNSAETAYLFRHALLRDAAYQLQLPGDRARLHALAFAAIEELACGRPHEPPALDAEKEEPFVPHPTDAFAHELADHARQALPCIERAQRAEGSESKGRAASPRPVLKLYLRRAAEGLYQEAREIFRKHRARRWEGHALGNLAIVYQQSGRVELAERTYGQALTIHRETGNRRFHGIHSCAFALCFLSLGRGEDARRAWREGIGLLESLRDTDEAQRHRTAMRAACAKAGVPPFDAAPP